MDFCKNLEEKLKSEANLRVYFDDRDIRAGKKYYEWEMRGVPLRIEVGPRDLQNKKVVTYRRDTQEKEIIDYDPLAISETTFEILGNISLTMKDKALEIFDRSIRSVDSIEEAADEMSKAGGIITFDWCGDQDCGKEIEEKVRVDILGVQESDKKHRTCINCEKPSKHLTLIAKTY